MAIDVHNIHKKIDEDWPCNFRVMEGDRQTNIKTNNLTGIQTDDSSEFFEPLPGEVISVI